MKIIRTNIIPPKGFDAINLFGLFFIHKGVIASKELINHERIHTRQMMEMGFIFFYLWYVLEWVLRLPQRGNAYRNISFEREAYENMNNLDYLKNRNRFAWTKYIRKERG